MRRLRDFLPLSFCTLALRSILHNRAHSINGDAFPFRCCSYYHDNNNKNRCRKNWSETHNILSDGSKICEYTNRKHEMNSAKKGDAFPFANSQFLLIKLIRIIRALDIVQFTTFRLYDFFSLEMTITHNERVLQVLPLLRARYANINKQKPIIFDISKFNMKWAICS